MRSFQFFFRAASDMAIAAIQHSPVAGDFDDPRFPSHLHINVLQTYRGRSVGEALMAVWLEKLRQDESPGCHPGTVLENEGAQRFFARCGFGQIGGPTLVPVMRYRGRRVHQVISPGTEDAERTVIPRLGAWKRNSGHTG